MGDVRAAEETVNDSFESSFAEVELLKKSCVVTTLADVAISSAKWEVRQQLQDRYRSMLLDDLELSIKRGIEMDLWRFTCYSIISVMQAHLSKGGVSGALYRGFLNSSTGFFSQLLRELCEVHMRRVTAMPRSRYLGMVAGAHDHHAVEEHFKYICHFCLVKLGDIARYSGDSECSRAFYMQAIQVKPRNGQPYNQLAILSASEKSAVETLYLHVRSIALSFPFPAGQANLTNWLLKCVSSETKATGTLQSNFIYLVYRVLKEREPMTLSELCLDFLEAARARIETAPPCTDLFLRLTVILIFVHGQCAGKGEEYGRAVYGLLFELLSVLVSVVEETPPAAPKLLPSLTLLSHWVQLAYSRELDELVPGSLWADLRSIVRKQQPAREGGEEWEGKATPEEEDMRSFEPLRPSLALLGPLEKKAGNVAALRFHRLKELLHWASLKSIIPPEQAGGAKGLNLDGAMGGAQYNNTLPISPMYVPYQMVPSAPALAYQMNHPERQPAPFRMNPDSPFLAPPEPQRPSFLRQFPSVVYHAEAMGLAMQRGEPGPQEQAQSFIPPGQMQSYIPSKFLGGGKQFLEQEQQRMIQGLVPDQRSLYRPNPNLFPPPPMLNRPSPATSNSQFGRPAFPASQFPNLVGGGTAGVAAAAGAAGGAGGGGGVKPKGKEEDLFVSSASPFSLVATPWNSASEPRGDLDIWPLTGEDHDLSSLHQLLNGKK